MILSEREKKKLTEDQVAFFNNMEDRIKECGCFDSTFRYCPVCYDTVMRIKDLFIRWTSPKKQNKNPYINALIYAIEGPIPKHEKFEELEKVSKERELEYLNIMDDSQRPKIDRCFLCDAEVEISKDLTICSDCGKILWSREKNEDKV